MRPIIQINELGKQYRIGARLKQYERLSEAVLSAARKPLNWFKSNGHGDTIWALKDVNLEVQPGEVVGIIGRNGAGKSTLLKILSRITEPTTGRVDLYGRVGSLLEVGTGFHPELSGRENVYLSGAILGMRKAEIRERFDEIVAFAEVDRFIDTPVKRYSSGMYMRLAFAVAAHLNPEILIVDEVLAVGDPGFQKKCLGKMNDVAGEGRTVLFVSHNMSAVGRLCTSVAWMDGGQIVAIGDTREIIGRYLRTGEAPASKREWPIDHAPGDEFVKATTVEVTDLDGQPMDVIHQDDAFVIAIGYRVLRPMTNANVGFELKTADGVAVFRSFDADNPIWSGCGREPGFYRAECKIPAHLLNEGSYSINLLGGIPFFKLCVAVEDALRLDISPGVTDDGPSARMGVKRQGVIAPALDWTVSALN